MLKTIISDINKNSRDVISAYLKAIDDVEIVLETEDFEFDETELKNINLIIFDIKEENSALILDKIKMMSKKYENLNFIATSYEINSELVSKTLKEGVSDFLLKPVLQNVLSASVKKIADRINNIPSKIAKTISIFSNKGGAGKTSIAVNCAYEISKLSKEKVCLLDLCFNSQDTSTFLDIKPKFSAGNILNKLETSDENLLLSLMNKYKNSNLYIFSIQDEINLHSKFNPKIVLKIINSLKALFPYLIIDTSNIIDEITVSILNASDLIIYPVELGINSVRNCQKSFELFNNLGIASKIKLVLNRFVQNSQVFPADLEKAVGVKIFAKIPNNYSVLTDAINKGKTVEELSPDSNIAKAYKNLAYDIINTDFIMLNSENKLSHNHGMFNLLRKMGD